MQTLTITFQIPDGVQFQVNATGGEPTPAPVVAVDATATKPAGTSIEDVRTAFKRVVFIDGGKYKAEAFAALGCAKLSDLPESSYQDVIDKLNAVAK